MPRPLSHDHLDIDLRQLDLDLDRLARASGKAAPPKAPRATATRGTPRWPSGEPIELPANLSRAERTRHLGALRAGSARDAYMDRLEHRGAEYR